MQAKKIVERYVHVCGLKVSATAYGISVFAFRISSLSG